MYNVLVTAIGSFSADVVIQNLKRKNCNIIACDIYPKEWIADAYQVNKFYQAPYATKTDDYISFLQSVCEKEKISHILPLTDIEVDVLNKHRAWFIKHGIILCMSSCQTIKLCRNKKELIQFIEENKLLRTIPTKPLSTHLTTVPDFPIVCKPIDGRSSQGLHYIHHETEWNALLETVDITAYIVQPYIDGDVVTVDVLRDPKSNLVVTTPRKELLRTQNGAGTSVYVFTDSQLQTQCATLANQLKIIGCANFEFIKDSKNQYHFLECNPRFSGGIEFSCIAGYDYIANHLRCFNEKSIEDSNTFSNQYIARKYEEYVTQIATCIDF